MSKFRVKIVCQPGIDADDLATLLRDALGIEGRDVTQVEVIHASPDRCGKWVRRHPSSPRCKLPKGHAGGCSQDVAAPDLMAALKASLR